MAVLIPIGGRYDAGTDHGAGAVQRDGDRQRASCASCPESSLLGLLSATKFFYPLSDAWSPADNVRHLLKSNRPVLRALSTPKILLLARFGAGLRASRTYAEIRERYLARLAGGVTAGRFAPRPLAGSEQTEEQRRSLLADLDQVSEHLTGAVSGWRQLDRLRLPHPALGRLTVREMLFFTLYHNLHHVRNVERRMTEA